MKAVNIIERSNCWIVDGYSTRKSEEAAIKDFGQMLQKKIGTDEGILEYGKEVLLPMTESCGGYYFEMEETESSGWYMAAMICKF